MRERLTFAFVALAALLLIGAGAVRTYALEGQVREHETQYASWEARTVGQFISARSAEGHPVDAADLQRFAEPDMLLTYAGAGAAPVMVHGGGYTSDGGDQITADVVVDDGTLTLTRTADDHVDALGRSNWTSLLGLFVLLVLLAGVLGYVVARALSEPFRQLAQAAAALGRGRFDLDLPRTRVPEARAIAQALAGSAAQLRERLEREREFGLHTSHVLRTPITSLRFQLEELLDDPDLSEESRAAALGALKATGRLSQVAGELVDLSGRGVLVAGAALPLREVATQVAQHWADVLDADGGRLFSAAVEGDLELTFTPGPIEQVLDQVLADVVVPSRGTVRMVLEGEASRLRVDITCTAPRGVPGPPGTPPGPALEATLLAVGGKVELPQDPPALRVYLPRR